MSTRAPTAPPAAWRVLYRGPLSSCNYACGYCPFAKRKNSRAELAEDARQLARFVAWVLAQAPRPMGVLFTPWGEAMVRRSYQRALVELSRAGHVERVAIQTNLSGRLDWLEEAERTRLALWTTWHPGEVSLERFAARCGRLDGLGVRYSVGVVGLPEHMDRIEALRGQLPEHVYLWVNALKRAPDPYDEALVRRIEAVDPLFRYNTRRHASLGRVCAAGASVFSVDGDGTARRCHFIAAPLGNIYAPGFAERLTAPRACTNARCGCHIGYVHLEPLALYPVYAEGVLERIPAAEHWRDAAARAKLLELARAALGPHGGSDADAAEPWAGARFT